MWMSTEPLNVLMGHFRLVWPQSEELGENFVFSLRSSLFLQYFNVKTTYSKVPNQNKR